MTEKKFSSVDSRNEQSTKTFWTEAAEFLRRRFDSAPGHLHILIWTVQGKRKRSYWFPAIELDKAESFFAYSCKVDIEDIYVGVYLSSRDFGLNKRCESKNAVGIAGFWADIDVKGKAHKQERLPETLEQAQELARSLGVEPTEEIYSGHGLQVWWLFQEAWIFSDDSERQQAAELSRRIGQTLQAKAAENGWVIDSTHDLARVLRLPGTLNHKLDDPSRVQVLCADGPRCEPGDFLALLSVEEIPQANEAAENESSVADRTKIERARQHVKRMPAAIGGQGGHQATWAVAQVLLRGFDLSPNEARPIIHEYNQRCVPPWTEEELEHKINEANTKSQLPRGYLLNSRSHKQEAKIKKNVSVGF